MRIVVGAVFLLALETGAGAHVVVLPSSSEVRAAQRYTVVVPTEGDSPTVKVEVRLPMGVQVAALEAKPGWEATNRPFPIGAATIGWSGGKIPPDQMMTFDFLAMNPSAARVLTWNATQWYEDGTSDRWGEGAPADHEAATTALVAASEPEHAGAPGHPAVPNHLERPDATQHPAGDGGATSASLWIAIVALVVALAALLVAVRPARRDPRPAAPG